MTNKRLNILYKNIVATADLVFEMEFQWETTVGIGALIFALFVSAFHVLFNSNAARAVHKNFWNDLIPFTLM